MSFTLVVLRARHPDTVRRLSGMSQLVGYGIGAAGPFAIGAVYAATDGWTVPLVLLLAVAAALAIALAVAGRRRWVDAPVFHGEEAPSSPSGGPGHRGPGGAGRSDDGA